MSQKSLALKEPKSISLFPSESEWMIIKDQATTLVRSGLLPKAINTPEKAIAIAIKGRELGIPMMQAFSHIHIIDGKPGCSAELMLSLLLRNCTGAVVDYLESTDKVCVLEAKRPGRKPTKFGFAIEEARRAGLLSKDNWQKYPAAMLRARAVAITARAYFPDAIMGMSHLAEELGAETDEDGQVIEIPNASAEVLPDNRRTAQAPPKEPAPVGDRKQLGDQIREAAGKLNLTQQDVNDWIKEEFEGKATRDLSVAEMQKFLVILQRELGLAGVIA